MGIRYRLIHYLRDAELCEREPWWIYVWLVWACICAAIIFFIDQSLTASLLWVFGGILVAFFGLPLVMLVTSPFFSFGDWLGAKRTNSSEDVHGTWLDLGLDVIDPKLPPWGMIPALAIGFGLFYGVLLGAICGAISPLICDWPETALEGALIGSAGGAVFVGLLVAVEFPLIVLFQKRGPSIEGLRQIVCHACRPIEELDHLTPSPGHLLIAIFEKPSGAVLRLLGSEVPNRNEIVQDIFSSIPQRPTPDENENVPEAHAIEEDAFATHAIEEWMNLIVDSIEQARELKHAEVEAGHVLLSLLQRWPDATVRALKMAGLDSSNLRQQVLICMEPIKRANQQID